MQYSFLLNGGTLDFVGDGNLTKSINFFSRVNSARKYCPSEVPALKVMQLIQIQHFCDNHVRLTGVSFQHSTSLTCFDLCPRWGSSEEAECFTCSCLGVIFLPAGYFAPIGLQSSTESIRFCPGICVGTKCAIHVGVFPPKPSLGFSIGVTSACIPIRKFDGLLLIGWFSLAYNRTIWHTSLRPVLVTQT